MKTFNETDLKSLSQCLQDDIDVFLDGEDKLIINIQSIIVARFNKLLIDNNIGPIDMNNLGLTYKEMRIKDLRSQPRTVLNIFETIDTLNNK